MADLCAHRLDMFLLGGLLVCAGAVGPAAADEVYLTDGSRLTGTVRTLHEEVLVLETDFAGEMELDASQVRGITTDGERVAAFDSGDRVVGVLRYTEEEGQVLANTSMGDLSLGERELIGLWDPDALAPEAAERQRRVEELESPWSGRLEFGLDGDTGNNERISFRGGAEAERETDLERLLLSLNGRYAQDEGERSANEILGAVRIERDISDRFFAFGRIELEFDEFENLDLRTTVTAGFGYFFIKEEDHELKGRAGLGYEHESFDDGTVEDDAILEIGYDYRLDLNDHLRFTHGLTYYPTLGDPLSEYRLTAETGGEVPLTADEAWKLRVGVRNNYDATPQPGVERLDTAYFVNLVYDWD